MKRYAIGVAVLAVTELVMADTLLVPSEYASIQEAIDASADGDVIEVDPGSYNERLDTGGKSISIIGINGYPQTILDPQGGGGTLLTVANAEVDLQVEGFTFRNGQNSVMTSLAGGSTSTFTSCRWLGGTASTGAAISMDAATATFNDCQWVSNISTSQGGAIYANSSTLTFTDGQFTTNQCSGTEGGAMWLTSCMLNMNGTEFTGNQNNGGDSSFGGAIWMTDTDGTWEGCLFQSNLADAVVTARGGDVWMGDSNPTISNCVFEDAVADVYKNDGGDNSTWSINAEGGSLYLNGSNPQLSNCSFVGSKCVAYARACDGSSSGGAEYANSRARGGALYLGSLSNPQLDNVDFSGCNVEATGAGDCGHGRISSCAYGGAIWGSNVNPNLTNCTFDSCTSTRSSTGSTSGTNIAYAGAIYLENLASPTILSSTFANCESQYGGVIYATDQSSPFVADTTFSSNTSSDRAGAVYSNDSAPSFAGCLWEGNAANTGGAFYTDGSAGYYPQIGTSTFCGNSPQDTVGQWFDDGGNAFLAECGDDCDGNGLPDAYEIAANPDLDCNENNALDACEIAANPAIDCDEDGIIDTCEAGGGASDCDGDGVLDSCEDDCNDNGLADPCEVLQGLADDCNGNLIPDDCEIADGTVSDCDADGIPDSCQADCDDDGTSDSCAILDGAADCDGSGVPDSCELDAGVLHDVNNDGYPDECQVMQYAGLATEIMPILGRLGTPDIPLTAVTYRIYAMLANPNTELIGFYGDEIDPLVIQAPQGFYQHSLGSNFTDVVPCDPDGEFEGLGYDSWLTIGASCDQGQSFFTAGLDMGDFNSGTGINDDDGIIFVEPGGPWGLPDASGRVLLAQLTSVDGSRPTGSMNLIGVNDDDSDWQAFGRSWPAAPLTDCNGNDVQDALDIAYGPSLDCDASGVPDECEYDDPYADCNENGIEDICDVISGTSEDLDGDFIPDECECAGDVDQDGVVNVDDIILLILEYGATGPNVADLNGDLVVNVEDIIIVLGGYGQCL